MIGALTVGVTTGHLGVAAQALAIVVLAPMLWVSAWIWLGYSRPSAVLVLEGFQMFLLAPSWVILVAATATGRWPLAVLGGLVAGSHLCFCLPAVIRNRLPDWARDAPAVSVFVANVRYDNDRRDDVAGAVLEADADIVIVNEITPQQREALKRAGVYERYPMRLYTEGRPFGEMLMTRLPVTDERIEILGRARVPAATIRVGERDIRVYAVHVDAPKSSEKRNLWRRDLDGIGHSAEQRGDQPRLYVGDFNSAPWHGPFRRLLDRGLTDAHDALGKGLTRSWTPKWPVLAWVGAVMRLDHGLYTEGIVARSVRDVEVPGSDHRGFHLTVAVQQPDR